MSWHLQNSTDRSTAIPPARKLTPPASRGPAKLLVGLVAAAGLAGCASPGPYNPAHLATGPLSQVQEICRSTLGLSVGTGLMADCVGQLSRSAVALNQGRAETYALRDARRDCLSKGLAPGQPALGECELSTASANGGPRAQLASMPLDGAPTAQRVNSYYNASFDEVRRREKAACARIGYDPVDGASFASCVASLDAALYASEHAPQ
jgi:hypothetical protein